MNNETESDILTLTEVSKMLHLHPNTLRNYDTNGTLKALRMGKKRTRRYRRADVEAFIKAMGEPETK
ncbi:helix-turn-helix domain-containing protein [Candidatus Saccharibacteria bacterium]|nr:helix-turn-helix domain-containing protein [Candidatus Saccharibacteria bacterium]